jgi:hypothetical protein
MYKNGWKDDIEKLTVLGFIGACGIPAAREAEAGGSRI